jgi:hypothetical protein
LHHLYGFLRIELRATTPVVAIGLICYSEENADWSAATAMLWTVVTFPFFALAVAMELMIGAEPN